MASGNLQVGRPITPTTGSAQVVVPRSCQLLGFMMNTAATIILYDASQATTLPTAILTITPTTTQLGWYPFPVDLVNGLVANVTGSAGAVTFVIA
jgi:hypothetical protein